MTQPGIGFALHPDEAYLALVRGILEEEVDFFEVNPEALWRMEGGRPVRNAWFEVFAGIRRRSGKTVVAHGLDGSLVTPSAGDEERSRNWLEALEDFQSAFDAAWISEHSWWTRIGGIPVVLPCPAPATAEALEAACGRLRALRRIYPEVLVENSANAVAFEPPLREAEFLDAVAALTPCGLLLDLHNLHTEAVNRGQDPETWIAKLDLGRVVEIHLSGGSESDPGWLPSGRIFRLDSHDAPVPEAVWSLYESVLPRCPNLRGVVVERLNGTFGEAEVPGLRDEVRRARDALRRLGSAAREMETGSDSRTPGPLAFPSDPRTAETLEGLASLLVQDDPVGALEAGGGVPDGPVREALQALDPDGLRITGLIVRKLRFERLCRGDSRLEEWFDTDPEGFVRVYRAYEADVLPRDYHAHDEVRTFRGWCTGQGIVSPADP